MPMFGWIDDRETSPMTLYWSMKLVISLFSWVFTKAQAGVKFSLMYSLEISKLLQTLVRSA